VCGGFDNDCDGVVDEGNPGGGVACSTGLLGVCAAGTTACVKGTLRCMTNTAASPERCDGLDNDCDGEVDENDAEEECDTGLLGACAKGTLLCTDGVVTCAATTLPGTMDETCNGKDDDCDGEVDEGNPPGGDACSTDLLGVCSHGVTDCSSGSLGCVPTTPASAERCNGLDDDCDDEIDGDVCADDLESGASGWALGSLWSLRSGGHSGTQSLRGFWTNTTVGCSVSSDAVLLTDIDLTSAASATIEFATMATVGSKDFLELYVSTDGGLTWSFLSSVGATSYWATLRYSLDQFVGAPHVRVKFSFYNGCGDTYGVDWSIDDVRILITAVEE
jgi:hypothetical protein